MAIPYYGHGFYTRQLSQFLYMDMFKILTFYTWSLSDLPYMVTKPPYDHEKYMSKLPERYFF